MGGWGKNLLMNLASSLNARPFTSGLRREDSLIRRRERPSCMPRGEAFSSSSSSSPSSRLPRPLQRTRPCSRTRLSARFYLNPPPREAGLTGTSIVARCLSLALRRDKLRNGIIPGGRRWRGRRERGRRRLRDEEGEGGRERESDYLPGAGSASLLRSSPLCSLLIAACARGVGSVAQ